MKTSDIKRAQRILNLDVSGVHDELTCAAIKNFQLKNNLNPTGNLDVSTKEILFVEESELTTDVSERYDELYESYHLPDDEYIKSATDKQYIFLHHTAGWNNPYRVIDMWAHDKRGRIGTHYVIGGTNPRNGDDTYDGKVLQCIDDEFYAWHLGGVDRYMHKHSLGIEICNFGYLEKRGGDFYTYTGLRVDPDQVVDLGYKFRGYRYYHKYSRIQLAALKKLLFSLTNKHDISASLGLYDRINIMSPNEAFGYYDEAFHGEVKGILSHTSVRRDKFDVSPQPNLINTILSL